MSSPSSPPPLAPSTPPSSSPSSSFRPRLDPFRHLTLSEVAIIVEFLNPIDIVRSQLVCRRWRTILDSYHISRVALIKHFPMEKETFKYKLARQRESLMPVERPSPSTTTTTTAAAAASTSLATTTSSPITTPPALSQKHKPPISPETPPLLPTQTPNPISLPATESPKEQARNMSAKGKGKRPARDMDPDSEREKKREREEDEEGDARLQFRRCVYRAHTRMMGMPTQVLWHRLEPGGDGDPDYALEWDITGGKWSMSWNYGWWFLLFRG